MSTKRERNTAGFPAVLLREYLEYELLPYPPHHRIAIMLEFYVAGHPQAYISLTSVILTQPLVYCTKIAGLSWSVPVMSGDHNSIFGGDHLAIHAGEAGFKIFWV